MIKREMSLS